MNRLRRQGGVLFGGAIVVVWCLLAVLAPLVAPADPLAQSVTERLRPPSAEHPFGTDELGRDVLSRVLHGARITIPAGLLVVFVNALVGTAVGAIAGFAGRTVDEVIMRTTELFMAFPTIILAMAITAALGPELRNAVIALAVVRWTSYARLVRGLVIEVKGTEYVEATRALGARGPYLLLRSVLPNTVAPVIVYASLDVGNAILLFAGLSFLGLGPEPSSPEWGRMVSAGIQFFDQWWMWLAPGLAIAGLVVAFNFIGDGLRDVFDPRERL